MLRISGMVQWLVLRLWDPVVLKEYIFEKQLVILV